MKAHHIMMHYIHCYFARNQRFLMLLEMQKIYKMFERMLKNFKYLMDTYSSQVNSLKSMIVEVRGFKNSLETALKERRGE